MKFAVDGVETSSGVVNNNNGTWSYTWPISTLRDATYSITATALDSFGNRGQPVSLSVQLARGSPSALTNVTGGYNKVNPPGPSGSGALAVELDWDAVAEGSVTGYEVWKGGSVVSGCTASLNTTCMDTSPATTAGTVTTYTIKTNYTDGAGNPQQTSTTYNVTAPGSSSTLPSTYGLVNTHNNGNPLTNCSLTPVQPNPVLETDLVSNYPTSGGTDFSFTQSSVAGCMAPFSTSVSMSAGTATWTMWFTNTSTNKDCSTANGYLYTTNADGSAGPTLAGSTPLSSAILRNTTTPVQRTFSRSVSAQTFPAGLQIQLWQNVTGFNGCSSVALHFGSGTYKSTLTLPTLTGGSGSSLTAPSAPTGLSAVHNPSDGTTTVSWTASSTPSGGIAPDFYRIYRDGTNYTNRVDTTDAVSTTVSSASVTGTTQLNVANASGFAAGQSILVDSGANQDTVTILAVTNNLLSLQGTLSHAHAAGVPVVNRAVSWTDTNVGAGTHTYYVTAASATLTESAATSGATA